MLENRRKQVLIAAISAAVLLFGTAFAVQNRIVSNRLGTWVEAKKGDLILGVDVIGQLEASESEGLGAPQIDNVFDFKIAMLAAEGSDVRKGQPVISFDTSELQRTLEQEQAEADSARKEIEKKVADRKLGRRDHQLRLAEAESKLRKAALKLDAPPDVAELNERRKIEFDHATSKKEVAYRREALRSLESASASEVQLLQAKLERATRRVRNIEASIRAMTVPAPRDGTVIYVINRRNEKKKVGESAWRGETILQIPDLNRLRAMGEVDEVDAGKVFANQRVTFKLDAYPDDEVRGKVQKVAAAVQRSQSKETLKIMKIAIQLDRVDATRMRPGMRFRGTLETDRARGVTLVPAEAIRISHDGKPAVLIQGLLGNRLRPVTIGRRNNKQVEIVGGLSAGDRVMKAQEAVKEEQS